jgi:hypothetical protein
VGTTEEIEMVTNTVYRASHTGSVKENHLAIRLTTELNKQENAIFSRRQIWRGFGILSTVLIGAAALAPNAFGIPVSLQPWVFLTSIFWFFAFCTGMFYG